MTRSRRWARVATAGACVVMALALVASGARPAEATSSSVAPFRSTDAFVRQQFQDFQSRTPTASEASAYGTPLANGSKTAAATVDAIAHLGTPAERNGNVTRLYTAYFQRLPDIGGLEYWINKSASGWTLNKISGNFAGSSEFIRKYGSLSNAAFVDRAFQNVFGRAADPGGRAYWINKLNKGMARGAVMVGFSQSSEYQRKQAPTVEMVLAYRGLLRRIPTGTEATGAVARVQADGFAALADDLMALPAYPARFPVPGAPGGLKARPASGQATLSWTRPAANGVPLAGYSLRVLKGGVQQGSDRSVGAAATSMVVTGLTNGQAYSFALTAHNANRDGSAATVGPIAISAEVIWSGYGGNASHDGLQPNGTIPASPTKKWETELDQPVDEVAVGDGRIYVSTIFGPEGEFGRLYALDPADGHVLWGPKAMPGDADGRAHLGYENGRVFAGTGAGVLAAFDAATGSSAWSISLGQSLFGPGITVYGGLIYTFDTQGLVAVDVRNGAIAWRNKAGGTFGTPAADATGVYLVQSCQYVFRFSATGTKIWSKEDESSSCEGEGDLAMLAGGRLWETDTGGGSTSMRRQTDGAVVGGRFDGGTPAVSGNTVVYNEDDILRFVDWTTGTVRASQDGNGDYRSPALINAGRAYVLSEFEPVISSYSLTDGAEVWSRNVELDTILDTDVGLSASPIAMGDGLLLVRAENHDFGDQTYSLLAYG